MSPHWCSHRLVTRLLTSPSRVSLSAILVRSRVNDGASELRNGTGEALQVPGGQTAALHTSSRKNFHGKKVPAFVRAFSCHPPHPHPFFRHYCYLSPAPAEARSGRAKSAPCRIRVARAGADERERVFVAVVRLGRTRGVGCEFRLHDFAE